MSTFYAEYPGEKLKLFETDSKGVIDMILSHHIDIGFTGTVIEKGNCKYLPFYEDELVVLTPANEKFVEKFCGGQILAVGSWTSRCLKRRRIRNKERSRKNAGRTRD